MPKPIKLGSTGILIYDSIFDQGLLADWVQGFAYRYAVKSGESLKDVENFAPHMTRIAELSKGLPTQDLTLIVLGGGSVGDFGAFVASVLRRGVRLVIMPSTWLSAVDSAYGGKTALNVAGIKNQIGTFYPAHEIFVIRELLATQPKERVQEALGEVIKIALISGGPLWKLVSSRGQWQEGDLWKILPQLVAAKLRIVKKDPLEQKGHRHVLNLGHSFGHVIESDLGCPHGTAVLYGLTIALYLSVRAKILSPTWFQKIITSNAGGALPTAMEISKVLRRCENLERKLLQDKKLTGKAKLRFVFVQAPGKIICNEQPIGKLLKGISDQFGISAK